MTKYYDIGDSLDHTGKSFGEWEVIKFSFRDGMHSHWVCQCSCGYEKIHTASSLTSGQTKRCKKCWELVRPEATRRRTRTHGFSGTTGKKRPTEYNIWANMVQRCTNVKASYYQLYGGRGIQVCEAWRKSFSRFLADMGMRPSKLHSIERVNNNGDYKPGNCRWATCGEQNRNMRKNRYVVVRGERMIISDACRKYGVPHATIWAHVSRRGLTHSEAFEEYLCRREDKTE